jgi:hypothetical protein
MSTPLTVALIGAALTAVGWLVTSGLQSLRDSRSQKINALLTYTQKQLEELYGPLSALIVESEGAYQDSLDALRRSEEDLQAAFPDAQGQIRGTQLSEEERETWLFWIEHSFFPRNESIKELIATKAYLIEVPLMDGGEQPALPDSYRAFLRHYLQWRMNHERWKEAKPPYGSYPTTPWPRQFDSDVKAAFKSLRLRHNKLLRERRTEKLADVVKRKEIPDVPVEALSTVVREATPDGEETRERPK